MSHLYPPEVIPNILSDSIISVVSASGLYGQLDTAAGSRILTIILAVTTCQEARVSVDVDIGLGQSCGGVLHELGGLGVNVVETGDGDGLCSVAEVLVYNLGFVSWLELIKDMNPPVKVEEINFPKVVSPEKCRL